MDLSITSEGFETSYATNLLTQSFDRRKFDLVAQAVQEVDLDRGFGGEFLVGEALAFRALYEPVGAFAIRHTAQVVAERELIAVAV